MAKRKVVHETLHRDEMVEVGGVKAIPFTRHVQSEEAQKAFDQMRAEAYADNDNHLSFEQKRDRWWDTMMNMHIDYQRSIGVAVPSAREAQKKISEIYERLLSEGKLDFHRPVPGTVRFE